MQLRINGEKKTLDSSNGSIILRTLLKSFGYHPRLVVVELNGEIINPKYWDKKIIKEGDILEIVTIVGGG